MLLDSEQVFGLSVNGASLRAGIYEESHFFSTPLLSNLSMHNLLESRLDLIARRTLQVENIGHLNTRYMG